MRRIVLIVAMCTGVLWGGPVDADEVEEKDFGDVRTLPERGDVGSQSFLAIMYEHGVGVPQDYAEAVKWYRQGR